MQRNNKSTKKTIAAIKRNRTARLAALVTKSYYLHRRKRDEEMYNLICDEFVQLGGVYIKFLQGVLLRSEVMRKWNSPDKLRIFENLDSEPLDIAKVLQDELPRNKLSSISLVQPQPFAAGSFGQVYYGQLRDGTPIIVKVLRPMVRELLKYDLKLLSTFSKSFFIKLYKNIDVQLDQAIKEFKIATLRETDYQYEATFADEMYRAYINHPSIVIPKTYLDLCTDNIIVQEYIGGLSLAQVVKMHSQGVDPVRYVYENVGSDLDTQLETFGYESLIGIFSMPRIQGDPHPGNIRLLPNNQVGLIDFGISASAPEEKAALFGMLESYDKIFKGSHTVIDLFEQGLRFFVSDLYKALNKIGDFMSKSSGKSYSHEVSKVAEAAYIEVTGGTELQKDTGEKNMLTLLNKSINQGNRFGLILKLESTEILRATQTFTTVVISLGRYEKVMPTIMDRVVSDVREKYPEVTIDNEPGISLSDAIDIVSAWLERVAVRDPKLFRQLSEKIRISTNINKNDINVKD